MEKLVCTGPSDTERLDCREWSSASKNMNQQFSRDKQRFIIVILAYPPNIPFIGKNIMFSFFLNAITITI